MSAIDQGHYHVACTKVFEVTHGLSRGQGLNGESVTHPNQYAAKSRELERAKLEASGVVKMEVKEFRRMGRIIGRQSTRGGLQQLRHVEPPPRQSPICHRVCTDRGWPS